jgi:hypothetical protein
MKSLSQNDRRKSRDRPALHSLLPLRLWVIANGQSTIAGISQEHSKG